MAIAQYRRFIQQSEQISRVLNPRCRIRFWLEIESWKRNLLPTLEIRCIYGRKVYYLRELQYRFENQKKRLCLARLLVELKQVISSYVHTNHKLSTYQDAWRPVLAYKGYQWYLASKFSKKLELSKGSWIVKRCTAMKLEVIWYHQQQRHAFGLVTMDHLFNNNTLRNYADIIIKWKNISPKSVRHHGPILD